MQTAAVEFRHLGRIESLEMRPAAQQDEFMYVDRRGDRGVSHAGTGHRVRGGRRGGRLVMVDEGSVLQCEGGSRRRRAGMGDHGPESLVVVVEIVLIDRGDEKVGGGGIVKHIGKVETNRAGSAEFAVAAFGCDAIAA
ncbi:hypothetical protein ABW21_db0204618 [Orbilia brochopaga]|nr:hypothetical protein ABW21_db0204618 [Drechslerella brochopaga]